jgi:hypothetical protein
MGMKAKLFFIVVLAMGLAGAAFAVEDQPKAVAEPAPDARLDQKVTFEAKGQLLYKVLDELTEKCGIDLNCGKNDTDWQVRDRKVSIFVKDMPLKDLQKELADLLHFTWARGVNPSDKTPSYRLFQDLKSRKEEAALRDQAASDAAKKELEKRLSVLSELDKLDSLTPEEIEKLKTDAPFLYTLATSQMGKGLTQVFRNVPDARAAIAEGREMSMPLSQMNPRAVDSVKAFIGGFEGLTKKFGQTGQSYSGLMDNIGDAKFKIKSLPEGVPGGLASNGLVGGILEVKAPGQPGVTIPLFDPRSPMANMIGRMLIKLDEGLTPEQAAAEMQADGAKAMAEMMKPNEPVDPLPEDPAFEKTVKLEFTKPPTTLPDILEEIHKKSDLQIVSDQFAQNPTPLSKTEGKLGDILKETTSSYGKKLDKTGDLLVFQDKKWFIKRAWEVPEASLERWRAKAKSDGLGFQDVVDISCLTNEQIDNTIRQDPVLGTISWQFAQQRPLLRLYAVLTTAQRNAMASKSGLDVSTLSAEQMPYFDYLVSKSDDKSEEAQEFTLSMKTESGAGRRTFTLDGQVPDPDTGEPKKTTIQTWDVNLPPPTPKDVEKPKPPVKKPATKGSN